MVAHALAERVASWQVDLLGAMLPAADAALPPFPQAARRAFVDRLPQLTPRHVRCGLLIAAVVCRVAPLLSGRFAALGELDPTERETVLAKLQRLPFGADLLLLAKTFACLAYFDDETIQRHFRGSER
ncbi:MAG: hypothetical protein H6707_12505 [Deltaproteobacteria bacterium]|nr:hypothetical protein [Deltaproteobacteria bacterium]